MIDLENLPPGELIVIDVYRPKSNEVAILVELATVDEWYGKVFKDNDVTHAINRVIKATTGFHSQQSLAQHLNKVSLLVRITDVPDRAFNQRVRHIRKGLMAKSISPIKESRRKKK